MSRTEPVFIRELHPVHNFPKEPNVVEQQLIDLQLLWGSGQDVDQPGFKFLMPGFRMNAEQRRFFAELIMEAYQRQCQTPYAVQEDMTVQQILDCLARNVAWMQRGSELE